MDVVQPELPNIDLVEVTEDQRNESYAATKREICDAIEMLGGGKVFASATNRTKSDVSRACTGAENRHMPIEFYDDLATVSRPAFEYAMNRFLRRHGYAPLQAARVATKEELYEALRSAVSKLGPGERGVLTEAARVAGLDVEAFRK